jgi:hypothetical protein
MFHPDVSLSPRTFFSQSPATPPQQSTVQSTDEKVEAQQNRISSLQSDDVLAFQQEINNVTFSIQEALDEIDLLDPAGTNNFALPNVQPLRLLTQRSRTLALQTLTFQQHIAHN